jgi:hypothetical protein
MTFIFFFRGGHKGWSILYHPFDSTFKFKFLYFKIDFVKKIDKK